MVPEELARLGWKESDLAARRKADPGKLAIAKRVRSETTLPIKWIAARVQIGTPKSAKSVLHRASHPQRTAAPAGKAAIAPKPCAQLEFQSAVCPLRWRDLKETRRLWPQSKRTCFEALRAYTARRANE
jgi:hypothetical protein